MANVETFRKQLTQIIDNLLSDFIRENKINAKAEEVRTTDLDIAICHVANAVGDIMDDIKPTRYEIETEKTMSFYKLEDFLLKMRWYCEESHALEVIHDTFFDGEHDGDTITINDAFLIDLARQIYKDAQHTEFPKFLVKSNAISYIVEKMYHEGLIETEVSVIEVKGGQELK